MGQGSDAWEPFEIPDGDRPVSIARLHADRATRAQVLLVHFPAGWSRPTSGSYVAAEELVVLDGSLEMSAATYRAGDWAYFPAGWLRDGTASPRGAIAFARFDGPARWTRGEGTAGEVARAHLHPEALDEPVRAAFGLGWPLRDSVREQSWYLAEPAAGEIARHDVELFDLRSRAWSFIPQGAILPSATGPLFARAFPRLS